MNMLRANRLCQALGLITRTGSRYSGIGAGIEVLDEQLAALQIGQHPLLQAVEARRRRSAG